MPVIYFEQRARQAQTAPQQAAHASRPEEAPPAPLPTYGTRFLAARDPDLLRMTLDGLTHSELQGLPYLFPFWALPHQLPWRAGQARGSGQSRPRGPRSGSRSGRPQGCRRPRGVVAELGLRLSSPRFPEAQATRVISACPRAEKRFMRATRVWISAAWRSGSREAMRSPKLLRRSIWASTRLRA